MAGSPPEAETGAVVELSSLPKQVEISLHDSRRGISGWQGEVNLLLLCWWVGGQVRRCTGEETVWVEVGKG